MGIKIVISPSKTYQTEWQAPLQVETPRFFAEAKVLRDMLAGWTRDELQQRMKLSEALTDQVQAIYQEREEAFGSAAISYYTGLVYKQLCLAEYKEDEWAYTKKHLRILSAMYGVLQPQDFVRPYRLDFLVKWPGQNLYRYWESRLKGIWEGDVIVDLASKEFGKMLPGDRIQIQFLQKNKKGEWISQSTKTKMARGQMVNWMIKQKIERPEDIQAFALEGYRFDPQRSTGNAWIFVQE